MDLPDNYYDYKQSCEINPWRSSWQGIEEVCEHKCQIKLNVSFYVKIIFLDLKIIF